MLEPLFRIIIFSSDEESKHWQPIKERERSETQQNARRWAEPVRHEESLTCWCISIKVVYWYMYRWLCGVCRLICGLCVHLLLGWHFPGSVQHPNLKPHVPPQHIKLWFRRLLAGRARLTPVMASVCVSVFYEGKSGRSQGLASEDDWGQACGFCDKYSLTVIPESKIIFLGENEGF